MSGPSSDPALERLAQDITVRLKRSIELAGELANQVEQWQATQPFRVKVVIADDRLSWELRVEVDPPPVEAWGVRFSDAIHHLRSVLDNLAWGLATLDAAEPQKPKAIQFPIVESRTSWQKEQGRIAELPDAAQTAIEELQPFQRTGADGTPESDALLLLSRLNNTDKHRIMILPQLNPIELAHSWSVEFRSDEEASQNVPPDVTISADAFVSGATLMRQVVKTPIVKVSGSYGFTGQVVVQDSVVGSLGITTILVQLEAYVRQVVNHVLVGVATARSV